ncbi:MAG: glycosyltransferase family 4 protein [Bryobacterales bacterium]|jgi:glycosyltransferase involved in cell wall biosynthesis|nr:glycosyltransferase family 4 protein [Bryobacterales bacterium]
MSHAMEEPQPVAMPQTLTGRKILHADRGREMRGGQHQALLLMRGLQERGAEQVLLARPGSPIAEAASAVGIATFPLGYGTLRDFSGWADVTHAHDAASHLRATIADCGPLVVARRVEFPISAGVLSRWKYRNADRYVAVSRHVEQVLTTYGVPADKVRMVHDGVPALPLPVELRDVVALDSKDEGKCNDLIRQAAEIGGFTVHFAKDLPTAFQYARVFVYLSRSEGFGSAVALACGAGIPVVASRLPALEEVFGGVEAGALVENEPDAVAMAVRRLLDDEGHRQACGEAARTGVAPRFTIERMVSGTIAVYEELW